MKSTVATVSFSLDPSSWGVGETEGRTASNTSYRYGSARFMKKSPGWVNSLPLYIKVYSFLRATETNNHILWWLETTEIHSLPVLDAKSPKWRHWWVGHFLGAQGESVPCLLVSGGYSSPWLFYEHSHFCFCFHIGFFSVSSHHLLYKTVSPILIRIPVIIDVEPSLLQYDLILCNYICKYPISR